MAIDLFNSDIDPKPNVALFFFNDTATTEIYTLSLHDALPISDHGMQLVDEDDGVALVLGQLLQHRLQSLLELAAVLRGADRKSTRLNSSHDQISYAVFCLKKKTGRVINKPRPSWTTGSNPSHR